MMVAACLSLSLPGQDVLDAVYDESEPVPFEVIATSSMVVPFVTAQAELSFSQIEVEVPSLLLYGRVGDVDAESPADAQTSLTLHCPLLC